jgi:hypothetical protein
MSDHTFYSLENRHNERTLTIVNVTSLVSKPPTKEKRIRIKVRMILSGETTPGSPEWLDAAYAFVAKWHDPVSPAVDFRGFDLHFSAENLFDAKGVKAPKCQMRSFEVSEFGSTENPDVATTFTIYAPFSTKLWNWLGQFAGDECWCAFKPGIPDQAPASSSSDPPEDEDDEDESKEPDTSPGTKSGPKELADFHAKEVGKKSPPKKSAKKK